MNVYKAASRIRLQLYDACSYPLFIAHFFPYQHNHLCVNTLSLHVQNSRISHQGFCRALNEEY